MNRDCGCKHHARNIQIDPISINLEDRELNVQNALELLAAGADVQRLSNIIKKLESELTALINLKNQVSTLENKINSMISDYNLYGTINTDGIYVNPYYSGINEDFYYKTIFWDKENNKLLYPDLNNDAAADYNDYNILFYLKYAVDQAYENKKINELIDYLELPAEQRTDPLFANFSELSEDFSNIIIDLLNNNRKITDYDLQILSDYVRDKTNNKLIYIDGSESPVAIPNGETGFNAYMNYKNPLLFSQMPNLSGEDTLSALDAALVLDIASKIGAGNESEIAPEYQKWAKDYMKASLASEILEFVADVGVGTRENTPEGWAQYVLEKEN